MLLILKVAVISVPALVDGVAYLAGSGRSVTFVPVSYQTNCYLGACQTTTAGILKTSGPGVEATWPQVVPLGQPFQVREPPWRWGLGEALSGSRGIAVVAVFLSLLVEAAAVLVIISLVRPARSWLRHRRQPAASAPAAVTGGPDGR
jgi:hypothetical protein